MGKRVLTKEQCSVLAGAEVMRTLLHRSEYELTDTLGQLIGGEIDMRTAADRFKAQAEALRVNLGNVSLLMDGCLGERRKPCRRRSRVSTALRS